MGITKQQETYDLAVVGQGIVGMITAYFCRMKWPDWKILAVEKQKSAKNATFYSAGLIIPVDPFRIRSNLSLIAESAFNFFDDSLFGKTDVILVTSRQDPSVIQYEGKIGTQLSPEFIRGRTGTILNSKTENQYFFYSGGCAKYIYPPDFIKTISAKFRENNLSFIRYDEVRKILQYKDGYRLCTAGKNHWYADRVVIAAGSWLPNFLTKSGISFYEEVKTKKIVSIKIFCAPSAVDPLLMFPDDDAFLLPCQKGGYWILSIYSDDWNGTPDKIPALSASDQQKINYILQNFTPSLLAYPKEESIFYDTYSQSKIPLIKEVKKNFLVAFGTSGKGIRLSPGIALQIIEHFKQ